MNNIYIYILKKMKIHSSCEIEDIYICKIYMQKNTVKKKNEQKTRPHGLAS